MIEHTEIDPNDFVDARAAEIQALEAKIKISTKKTMLFQRLPFHKRRRTKSSQKKKIFKVTRRKNSNNKKILKTHVWFAKRFEMVDLFGTKLPLRRREKSDKFIYKSTERGFITDESYKIINIYKRKTSLENNHDYNIDRKMFDVDLTKEIVFDLNNNIFINEDLFVINHCKTVKFIIGSSFIPCDIILTAKYIICVHIDDILINKYFESYEHVKKIDFSLSLVLGTRYFPDSGIYIGTELINKDVNEHIERLVYEKTLKDENSSLNNHETENKNLLKSDDNKEDFLVPFIFFKSIDGVERGKILTTEKDIMKIWQFLHNKGIIPISINERLRIGIEKCEKVYPYDFPLAKHYKEYEKNVFSQVEAKYLRTPPSKRVNYIKNKIQDPFYLPESVFQKENLVTLFFEADKGSIERMAVILNSSDEVVGYVLRGGYCFSIGKCRGLCVIFKSFSGKLVAKNINGTKTYPIKIIDSISN